MRELQKCGVAQVLLCTPCVSNTSGALGQSLHRKDHICTHARTHAHTQTHTCPDGHMQLPKAGQVFLLFEPQSTELTFVLLH